MQIKPTENLLQTEKKISKKQVRNKEGDTETESFADLLEEIDVVELSSNAKDSGEGSPNLFKDSADKNKKEEYEEQPTVPHVNRFV